MKEKAKKIGYVIYLNENPEAEGIDNPPTDLCYLFQFKEARGMESLSFRQAKINTVYEDRDEEDICFFTRFADAERALKRLRTIRLIRGYYTEIHEVWMREIDQSIYPNPIRKEEEND